MKLNEIANNPGATKKKTKVGRGSSSGLGKTCGRGVKGAKARTGNAVYGFEGGQMPLHMRMPKRGFNNIFGTDFAEINLGRLQKAVDEKKIDVSAKIDLPALKAAGLVSKSRDGVRLLAKGELSAKLNLEVAGASKSAVEAVEKAGGSVVVTYKKKVTANKKGEPGKRQQRRIDSAKKRAERNG
ncbi:large subunit ribosomal protein L15 [Rhizomicrobium palustre]|uniref:Large ribosomal subunit protein uL15 n=1 Tax=Rhizomicrobium palustre TaxID=189966 RepID=A0A846N502_9PROT|nr:50S ribosomal protein L15 [Rhizomicrobium palustre]NIK90271.1 large subunit ribosomal protein L15 [Rhizomicrobium palustre]